MAPVATAVYLAVVLALAVGRYRWAWLLLALLNGAVVISWAFDPHRFAAARAFEYGVDFAAFALLVSRPTRRRLRHPVLLPWRVKDGTPAP